MIEDFDDFSLFDVENNADLISLLGSIDLTNESDISIDKLIEDFIDHENTLLDILEDFNFDTVKSSTSPESVLKSNLPHKKIRDIIKKISRKPKRKLIEENTISLTIYKSPKLAPVVKKEFYQFPYELTTYFNAGDIASISKGFHHIMHSRCLFQINEYEDMNNLTKFDGPSSIAFFFNSLISLYPDGLFTKQKVKTKYINDFQVVSCKFNFVGTKLPYSRRGANALCPDEDADQLDHDMINTGPTLIKAKMDLYIDENLGRVVLNDARYYMVKT